jgi:probable F420-dependent oxidoreductase
MKLGIALGRLNPAFFVEATVEAERLGFESVWLPEHLVFTTKMSRSPHPGETHPPVPPDTPIFDAFAYLSYLAGITEHLRLGTHVYNIGLRHPFTAARAVQTLDIVSGGRVEFGIGASWLEEEWDAVELDFASRGTRVDEAVEICKQLWTEPEVSHHGEFFSFDGAVFEPKCVQQPYPPLLVGGGSGAALRRAARLGDGWIGMSHDLESGAAQIAKLRTLLEEQGRDAAQFQYCLGGPVESKDDIARWEEIGVTRLVFSPWRRSKEAIDGMRRFADTVGLEPRS